MPKSEPSEDGQAKWLRRNVFPALAELWLAAENRGLTWDVFCGSLYPDVMLARGRLSAMRLKRVGEPVPAPAVLDRFTSNLPFKRRVDDVPF